jgi:hypothetical protein
MANSGATLASYASPVVGRMSVADVDTSQVMAILEPLWRTDRLQLGRLRQHHLAHVLQNKTEEAYWRGDLFDKRVRLMQAWGSYRARQGSPSA